jgi:hypothetical protein
MEKNPYLCSKLGNMYNITVLEYNENGKLHAVKAIKDRWNMGLKEAKDWVEALPKRLEGEYSIEDVDWFQERFRCSVDPIENPYYSNHNIQEPDADTASALIWLSAQPDFIKDNIKLIGDWEHRNCFVVATC